MANVPKLDAAFVEKQRQRLSKVRAELLAAASDDESEEASVRSESAARVRSKSRSVEAVVSCNRRAGTLSCMAVTSSIWDSKRWRASMTIVCSADPPG